MCSSDLGPPCYCGRRGCIETFLSGPGWLARHHDDPDAARFDSAEALVNAMREGGPGWSNVECEDCGLLLQGDVRPNPLRPPFAPRGDEVVITCTP